MAEQRCPMCGRPNPPEAEECQHCGARLSPLDLSGAAGPAGGDAAAEGSAPQDDWLQRMRAQSEQEEEPAPADGEAGAELPSWMGEIEAEGPSDEGAERVVPFDATREPEGQPDAPEWLRRIRAKEEARAQQDEAESDEWVSRLRESSEAPAQPAPQGPAEGEPSREPAPGAEAAPEPAAEEPSWEPTPGEQAEPAPAGEADLTPGEKAETAPDESGEAEPEWEAEQLAPGEPPSWLSDLGIDFDMEQPEPEEQAGELPHVPALIVPEGGQPAPPPTEGEVDLPEWLGAITPEEEPQALPPAEGEDSRLAPATLPSWLEAMRPVETFRSVVQIESEDDQAVESAGPLAGLRGVLIAEPLVAMPRTATVGSMQLAVSERQYAQAELLHRMVEEEEREIHVSRRPRPRLNVIRWIIAGVMLFATVLPVLQDRPRFPLPSLEPRELGSLFTLIDTLPVEQPALLVFDYEPGYSGELDAVGEALIEQLMVRGVPIATMTTRPTGSPLALRVVGRLGDRHGYALGENLVHLGYLSGGPTAIQFFSLGPRTALLQGFALPSELREAGIGAWDTPMLREVDQLSDFSGVAVITAGTETARAWAEQAKGSMGDTPLVMVLSAGAEPMVRPYYEARAPRVNGILTGLPAATAYERRMGREGLSVQRWHAFGTAMLAGELILLAGIGFGLVQWWTERQQK